jgi:hypothetical protein
MEQILMKPQMRFICGFELLGVVGEEVLGGD